MTDIVKQPLKGNVMTGILPTDIVKFKKQVEYFKGNNDKHPVFGNELVQKFILWTTLFSSAKSRIRMLICDEVIYNKEDYYKEFSLALNKALNNDVKVDILLLQNSHIHENIQILENYRHINKDRIELRLCDKEKIQNINYNGNDITSNSISFEIYDTNAYRVELLRMNHLSICAFNDPKEVKKLSSIFDSIYSMGSKYKL